MAREEGEALGMRLLERVEGGGEGREDVRLERVRVDELRARTSEGQRA